MQEKQKKLFFKVKGDDAMTYYVKVAHGNHATSVKDAIYKKMQGNVGAAVVTFKGQEIDSDCEEEWCKLDNQLMAPLIVLPGPS